jgi:hypothetical protein
MGIIKTSIYHKALHNCIADIEIIAETKGKDLI